MQSRYAPPTAVLFAALCGMTQLGQAVGQSPQPTKATVSSWLLQQEQLVRSMRCVYDCTCTVPSTPETQAALDRALSSVKKRGLKARALRTNEEAAIHNSTKRLFRRGVKQRIDTFRLGADLSTDDHSSWAFDGHLVREVSPGKDGKPRATIGTVEKEFWNTSPRTDAWTFLYAYYEIPFSRLVAEAKSFQAESVKDAPGHTRISIQSLPGIASDMAFTMEFDDKRRLLKRDVFQLVKSLSKEARESFAFSGYEAHRDTSGETIWYPKQVVSSTIVQGVPTFVSTYTIREVEFNVDIPDPIFELKIPTTATVYDNVTGLGYLPPGTRPAALFPEEAARRRWWWVAAGVAAALAAVGGAWFVRRRRLKRQLP